MDYEEPWVRVPDAYGIVCASGEMIWKALMWLHVSFFELII